MYTDCIRIGEGCFKSNKVVWSMRGISATKFKNDTQLPTFGAARSIANTANLEAAESRHT